MRHGDALNPFLLDRLEQMFQRVKIVRRGVAATVKKTKECGRDGKVIENTHIVSRGEEYFVNCPNCRDTRQRLSISYLWGLDISRTDDMVWAIRCFNQECQESYEFRREFFERVYSPSSWLYGDDVSHEAIVSVATTPGRVRAPGPVVKLDELWSSNRGHHAITYLLDRQLDPLTAGKFYGAGYCMSSVFSKVSGRIVIPALMDGKLKGWTSRFIGDPPAKTIPKYYHMPGMESGKIVYNIDNARHCQTKILVEGTMDVWGVGCGGMAIFGTNFTDDHHRLIREVMRPGDVLVVMLDPKPQKAYGTRDRIHQLEAAYAKLSADRLLANPVVKAYLPEWLDPGAADRQLTHILLQRIAADKGLTISLVDEPL